MEINKIYNEDCLNALSKIPDNSIDCVITDPPYGTKTTFRDEIDAEYYQKACKRFEEETRQTALW